MSKRSLKQKESPLKEIVGAMPMIGFWAGIALLIIGIVITGCMFQAPVAQGHEIGII